MYLQFYIVQRLRQKDLISTKKEKKEKKEKPVTFFFFCSTGILTQDLYLDPLHQPFFEMGFFSR
jgi:hypothetical protein